MKTRTESERISLRTCSLMARFAQENDDDELFELCSNHAIEMSEQSAKPILDRVMRDARLLRFLEQPNEFLERCPTIPQIAIPTRPPEGTHV